MKRLKTALGFTLIEVLIAMTLLSIMVVLLFASLKICAQSWEKGESKMADVNEVAVVYHFFQQHLAVAKPVWDFTIKEQPQLAFQGDQLALQFVGEFPASVGKVGDQLFQLRLKDTDDGKMINVSVTPFLPTADGGLLSGEEIPLIKHVRGVSYAYFGPDEMGGEGSWQAQWLQRNSQPQLVKISIELDNAMYWPDMIVELKMVGSQIGADGTVETAPEESAEGAAQ